jgi:hypothetical protein
MESHEVQRLLEVIRLFGLTIEDLTIVLSSTNERLAALSESIDSLKNVTNELIIITNERTSRGL